MRQTAAKHLFKATTDAQVNHSATTEKQSTRTSEETNQDQAGGVVLRVPVWQAHGLGWVLNKAGVHTQSYPHPLWQADKDNLQHFLKKT